MVALSELPPSYENSIVAMDAVGNDSEIFTFEFVKSRLIQKERRASERGKNYLNACDLSGLIDFWSATHNERFSQGRS